MRNFVSEAWYINSLWFTWDNVWIDIGEGQFIFEWNYIILWMKILKKNNKFYNISSIYQRYLEDCTDATIVKQTFHPLGRMQSEQLWCLYQLGAYVSKRHCLAQWSHRQLNSCRWSSSITFLRQNDFPVPKKYDNEYK